MVALAIQKLQDVEGFVNGFLGYDLLARRFVPYGYAYPLAELYAGVGGGSNVPLGFISLSENLIMLGMGVWMLGTWLAG